MAQIFDIFLDALLDCLKLLPFLLATIFLMEYLEHRAADRFVASMQRAGRFGPLVGAGLGCVPQCGFSAACAELFNGGLVSAGTVVAVFLSTSDEALPILLANPDGWSSVLKLLGVKLIIAIAAGFLVDALWRVERQQASYAAHARPHECESDGKLIHIFLAALKRTLGIFLFLFLFTFLIALLVDRIGETQLAAFLLPGPFQPLLAAVIGLIPNCASSVLLTQLYLDGMISFGAAVSGLCTAAGIGLLVLLRGKRNWKAYAVILGATFAAAVAAGSVLQLFA